MVNRQSGSTGGVTVNVAMKDLKTEELYLKIFPSRSLLPIEYERIGFFTDGYDRWWKTDDPDGPAKMAADVLAYAVPWFDRPWPLEDQAREWYRRDQLLDRPRGWGGNHAIRLVLTLHRMGAFADARTLLTAPTPRTAIPSAVEDFACVRAYLGYD